jgi:FkbM family methyltransferase
MLTRLLNQFNTRKLRLSKSCQIPGLKKIYRQAFGNCSTGIFVEVGAFDGESFSNTSGLADFGWRGLYIEPISELAEQCKKRHAHNKVQVVTSGVGEKSDEIELNMSGQLSTFSKDTKDAYKSITWASNFQFESRKVPIETLPTILKKAGIPNKFDLLVVDVEGFEEQVFKGIELEQFDITMIIVELIDKHPDFAPHTELQASAKRVREHILSSGYMTIFEDQVNTVFLKKKT